MNESRQTQTPVAYDDEIDLRELFRVLWAGKWLIGGITFGATVIAVIVALMLPNIYRAEALLAPNDQERGGSLAALAAQYGGLADLARVNLGGGSTDKTDLGLATLVSRKFISEFIERHDILVPLMAATRWEPESGELVIDSDDFDVSTRKWVRKVSPPKQTTPSAQEAYEEFLKILAVSQDKKKGFVTIAIEHYSPTVANQWVDWLIDDLNSSIMHRDVAEAEQAIEYLNMQIDNTSLSGLQSVFFSLIEGQTKVIMLANVSEEYVFKTLDPAVTPEEKAKPRRALIVILTTLIGFLISIILVKILHVSSSGESRKP